MHRNEKQFNAAIESAFKELANAEPPVYTNEFWQDVAKRLHIEQLEINEDVKSLNSIVHLHDRFNI